MLRTKSVSFIFLLIFFSFVLAACAGLVSEDPQIRTVSQESTGLSPVPADQELVFDHICVSRFDKQGVQPCCRPCLRCYSRACLTQSILNV